MTVFLKTLKWNLDHDPSNGSLSKFHQILMLSFYIIPASFMLIGSVVFARSYFRHMDPGSKFGSVCFWNQKPCEYYKRQKRLKKDWLNLLAVVTNFVGLNMSFLLQKENFKSVD